MALPWEDSNMIYMIKTSDGFVKIGLSHMNRIKERMRVIQSNNHRDLELVRTIEDVCYIEEQWLHNHFTSMGLHIRGEWFVFVPEMLTVWFPWTPQKVISNPADLLL